MDLRVCRVCGKEKPLSSFEKCGSARYRRRICYLCHASRSPEEVDRRKAASRRRRRQYVHTVICQDSKKNDKRHGRVGNDLDRGFVAEIISGGCAYCGATTGRMTLDRIDNLLAHTKQNVKPACVRCNHIRNDMPFSAWMRLVPVIRELVNEGAFGDWRVYCGMEQPGSS